jgi:hypothetical protein
MFDVVCHEQRRHVRAAEAHTDAEARDAGLGDYEFRLAEAIAVTDAHLVVR